jgi:hypothetical protein
MTTRTIFLTILLLLMATLACSVLGQEALPAPTPTVVATPTLAPTATIDPAATPLGAPAGEATASAAGETSQPGPDEGTAAAQATADSGSTGGDNGQPAGTEQPGGQQSGGDGTGEQPAPVAAACPASGQNLLLNPSFEGDYKPFGAFTELNHAPNWFPWWHDGQNNLRPEFKPAEASLAPNRVHSGSRAQQYFKSFGQFKSGLYQPVLNITPGTRLQFSIYGQAWSCEQNDLCPGGISVNPANMLMRVGIDPTGDTNWSASTVVWSPYFNPLDQWQIACVEAVAEAQKVTVYVWASPDGPRQNQDVYWDDGSLVALP